MEAVLVVAINLQELVQGLHGMPSVKCLKLKVIGLPEIVHRGNQSLAASTGTSQTSEVYLTAVPIPVDRLQEDVIFVIGIMKRSSPHTIILPVEQYRLVLVIIPESQIVMIDRVYRLVDSVVEINTGAGLVGDQIVLRKSETFRAHPDGDTVVVSEDNLRRFLFCPKEVHGITRHAESTQEIDVAKELAVFHLTIFWRGFRIHGLLIRSGTGNGILEDTLAGTAKVVFVVKHHRLDPVVRCREVDLIIVEFSVYLVAGNAEPGPVHPSASACPLMRIQVITAEGVMDDRLVFRRLKDEVALLDFEETGGICWEDKAGVRSDPLCGPSIHQHMVDEEVATRLQVFVHLRLSLAEAMCGIGKVPVHVGLGHAVIGRAKQDLGKGKDVVIGSVGCLGPHQLIEVHGQSGFGGIVMHVPYATEFIHHSLHNLRIIL